MSRKIFTILLLAVFMLAQFSFALAAPIPALSLPAGIVGQGVTIGGLTQAYNNSVATLAIDWKFTAGAAVAAPSYVYLYVKTTGANPSAWNYTQTATNACKQITSFASLAIGTQTGAFIVDYAALGLTVPATGNVQFLLVVDTQGPNLCNTVTIGNVPSTTAHAVNTIVAPVAGTVTFTSALPVFSNWTSIKLPYSVTGMPGVANQYLKIWSRYQDNPVQAWGTCVLVGNMPNVTTSSGTYIYNFGGAYFDQDIVEFYATVDGSATCAASVVPATSATALGSTFIDEFEVEGIMANPPSLDKINPFDQTPVACNTFEMWALVADMYQYPFNIPFPTPGYSGFKAWNQSVTGTFAPPAPAGPINELLSWPYTFPAAASGPWKFSINPTDHAGNDWGGPVYFRNGAAPVNNVSAVELANCKSFTDTIGNANELYIRYLGTLGLVSGNPDGSFSPNASLSRAEAAVLFEKANGKTPASLPTAPSSTACTFTDVKSTDWFAGWVWQACKDGIMNGIGGGFFDPDSLITRGQIATIFFSIAQNDFASGSYLDGYSSCGPYCTVLNNAFFFGPFGGIRAIPFSDVPTSAYYWLPISYIYGSGIADATGPTTFSPDQPVLRGEFAKVLYRALSRVD